MIPLSGTTVTDTRNNNRDTVLLPLCLLGDREVICSRLNITRMNNCISGYPFRFRTTDAVGCMCVCVNRIRLPLLVYNCKLGHENLRFFYSFIRLYLSCMGSLIHMDNPWLVGWIRPSASFYPVLIHFNLVNVMSFIIL